MEVMQAKDIMERIKVVEDRDRETSKRTVQLLVRLFEIENRNKNKNEKQPS